MKKIISILLIVIGIQFPTQAKITNTIIDSVEYSYFNFPIVYDKVDDFEGTRIMHTSRVIGEGQNQVL